MTTGQRQIMTTVAALIKALLPRKAGKSAAVRRAVDSVIANAITAATLKVNQQFGR